MSSIVALENSPEKKIEALEKENAKLKKKIKNLQKTMDITTRHSDVVTGELEEKIESSIKEIEDRVRVISETIPVPVIIARVSDAKILYVNEHSCNVFGFPPDELIKRKGSDLYDDPSDRQRLLEALSKEKRVSDFEAKMKKNNGEVLWVALFSQILNFKNELCLLTVVYDLTERRKADDEIRKLRDELNQKEIKYLIFRLDDTEYGIEILNIREIVSMMPITPVINLPPYVKGVINLRGRVIPVIDFRLRLGLHPIEYTEQTCIIILDGKNEEKNGIIVDAVTNVCGIKAKDIEPVPELNFKTDSRLISAIAKSGNHIKILINSKYLSQKLT